MKICVIPDTQVKPDVPLDHLLYAGRYIASKKPDVVVMIGDWWDMESLCSYDKGKKSFEGRRYKKDIEHVHDALEQFNKGLNGRRPRKIMLLGNHEDRIDRTVDEIPELEGTISTDDFQFKKYGWEVHEYQIPVVVDGVYYCHNFPTGVG